MNEVAREPEAQTEEAIVYNWWQELRERKGNRAELRRAKTLSEVVLTPSYHMLRRRLMSTNWHNREGIASIAGALAHVDYHNDGLSFAALMASPGKTGQSARVSGLRFRRLLQHKNREDLYAAIIRVIRMLDKRANVEDLAKSLYWWNDKTRREWAFDYYDKSPDEK